MKDFIDALKLVSFPIHKEGYKFIGIFAFATILLSFLGSLFTVVGLVLTLWCVFFFRDPERVIPKDKNIIVSPADGVVTAVEKGVLAPKELGFGNKKFNKLTIFLNVFNVHVNRVPASGKISQVIYKEGKFLSANSKESGEQNERSSAVLEIDNGPEMIFVQVAGLVARRIINDLEDDQKVKIGERYGIIRFGSRADLYFPKEVEIKSLVGQTMIGGETIIAQY